MSKSLKNILKVLLVILLMMNLVACRPWTIVKNGETTNDGSIKIYFESDDFDADAFAKDVWENQLLDYYGQKKVGVTVLNEALAMDEEKAGKDYGIGSNDTGSSWTFIIEGTGKVLEVNKESRAGIMTIDLPPYDNESDMTLQIGPVIKGTTVRDTLDFIKLDDFNNQVQFASISKAFNALVVSEVLEGVAFEEEVGNEITFLACFTYNQSDKTLVTPIQVNFGEGK